MSLSRICRHIGLPNGGLEFCRPRPRKSRDQAQTWFILDGVHVRWVVKFSESDSVAANCVRNEARFLTAALALPGDSVGRRVLPHLVGDGEFDSLSYIVTLFVSYPPSHTWFPRRFLADPTGTTGWYEQSFAILDWLQSDSHLRSALGIPDGCYARHGDFSFMNILGRKRPETVVDWEDWSISDCRFHDAIQSLIMPTLLADDPLMRLESFREHWITGSKWSEVAQGLAQRFLDGISFRDALMAFLEAQAVQLDLRVPVLGAEFRLFLEEFADSRDQRRR